MFEFGLGWMPGRPGKGSRPPRQTNHSVRAAKAQANTSVPRGRSFAVSREPGAAGGGRRSRSSALRLPAWVAISQAGVAKRAPSRTAEHRTTVQVAAAKTTAPARSSEVWNGSGSLTRLAAGLTSDHRQPEGDVPRAGERHRESEQVAAAGAGEALLRDRRRGRRIAVAASAARRERRRRERSRRGRGAGRG